MLLFQLDPALCVGNAGVNLDKEVVIPSCLSLCVREGCCHSNLTHPFVGKAGVKFREGCCSNLTHAFVGRAGGKFREGSGQSKLTHPLVRQWRVKFRGGSGHSKLTHPVVRHPRV